MRWLLIAAMMLATAAPAQMSVQTLEDPLVAGDGPSHGTPADTLPDDPSEVLVQQANVVALGEASLKASGKALQTCGAKQAIGAIYINPTRVDEQREPCSELVYPYQRFLNTDIAIPLTRRQKGYLAVHDVTDPFNLATIAGISGVNIALDSHTAYGPGLKGFGKIAGVSLLQDTTGEFFGTFLIPSITHQDPRYYRMPNATVPKRLLYAVSRTFVARSDDGRSMPNYGTLLTYPISAEISNLYVPGIQTNGRSTAKRIATGLAIDPVNNLITEFLPDVAKRVHIRIIFVQQILNNIASNQGSLGTP